MGWSACGGGASIGNGLVRASDLPGRWLSHRHASAGDSQRDQRLGTCLGVVGVKVTKRSVGNDFNRDTPTGHEQVSSAASQWASTKMAATVRAAENDGRYTECVRSSVEQQAQANASLPLQGDVHAERVGVAEDDEVRVTYTLLVAGRPTAYFVDQRTVWKADRASTVTFFRTDQPPDAAVEQAVIAAIQRRL